MNCNHDSRVYFPGYRHPLCQVCYDADYLAWFVRTTPRPFNGVRKVSR